MRLDVPDGASIFDRPKLDFERNNLLRMKKLLFLTAALLCFASVKAQITSIVIDTVLVHEDAELTTLDGPLNLDGYITYRMYVQMTNATDELSAVFGEGAQPSFITTEGGFFQSPAGGSTSGDINPAFFPFDEGLQYDSFVTIGREDSGTPGTVTAIGGSENDPDFTVVFEEDPMSANAAPFNGGGFDLSGEAGGLWFTVADDNNLGLADPDDLQVLVMQFTAPDPAVTGDCVFGTLWFQMFPEGDQDNLIQQSFEFSTCPDIVAGCTDNTALNYDAAANVDNNSCLYPCSLAVDQALSNAPSCSYLSDGNIDVDASGQQGFLDYTLVSCDDPSMPIAPISATGNFNTLANGCYQVIVTDAVCGNDAYPDYDPIVLDFDFSTPALVSSISSTDVLCFGEETGTVSGNVTGGTAPYSVLLQGQTLDNIMEGADFTFEDIGFGVQIYEVFDANGCTIDSESTNVNSPFQLNVSAQTSPASCPGVEDGSINSDWTGGTGNVIFSIDGMDIMDPAPYAAGTWDLVGTDENGCTDTLQIIVEGPEDFMLMETITNATCFGDTDGMIDVATTGGNGFYTYTLNGSDATPPFMNLTPGEDQVIVVTDVSGCEDTFTLTVGQPDELTFATNVVEVPCNGGGGGSIEVVDVAGGNGGYEYSPDCTNYDEENLFTNLFAGDYDVCVNDMMGCVGTELVTVTQPDPITIIPTVTNSPEGVCEGAISIEVEGGTPEFTITWTGPTPGTGEAITDLCPGDYFVSIVDENGCTFDNGGAAINVIVGVGELENGAEITVFPNPSAGDYNLTIAGLSGQDVFYTITDLAGRVIENTQLSKTVGAINTNLDLTGEADGVYFLRMNVGDDHSIIRLIKQ